MRCNYCGSTNIQINTEQKSDYSFKKGILGSLIFGSAGAVAGINGKQETKTQYHCLSCGKIGGLVEVIMDNFTEETINRALSNNDIKQLGELKKHYRNIEWDNTISAIETTNIINENYNDFEIDNGVLIKYKGSNEVVVIPNNITAIGDGAFYKYGSLKNVFIPNNVRFIGTGAFAGCTSLLTVTIPNGVTSINPATFSGCISLLTVIIPNSVSVIDKNTFMNCSSLINLNVPNSVISIGSGAFFNCSSLKLINLGNGIAEINRIAFQKCISLTDIIIPKSVGLIGARAFYGCNSLTIKCETDNQPNGWEEDWNKTECPVVWGYKGEK